MLVRLTLEWSHSPSALDIFVLKNGFTFHTVGHHSICTACLETIIFQTYNFKEEICHYTCCLWNTVWEIYCKNKF